MRLSASRGICILAFCCASIAQTSSLNKLIDSAESAYRNRNFPAAIENYRAALKLAPQDEAATIGLALVYRDVYNYDEARRLLQSAGRAHPRRAAALVELGKLDIKQLHYDDAIAELKRAVAREPSLAAAHEQLGLAYKEKGDLDSALKELTAAIRLNPRSAEAHFLRGEVYLDREDAEHAYQDARKALDLAPNVILSRVLLAKSATKLGKCKEAVDLLKPLTESSSAEPEQFFLLSKAYACAGNADEARATQAEFENRSQADQEARTRKMDADHLAAQAAEAARQNQLAPALDLLQQAIAKDPGNGPSHALMAKIDFSRGDVAKAHDEITNALRGDPYNPDYLYVLGKVLAKEGQLDAALHAFTETTLVNPRESDAYFEIAQIYLQEGSKTQAIEAMKRAVALSPDDPDYKRALAELTH